MTKACKTAFRRRAETGATSIEYGLIISLIGIVIISSLQGLSAALSQTFNKVSTSLSVAASDDGAGGTGASGGAGAGAGSGGSGTGSGGGQEWDP